jgi:hypothetical protein
MLLSLRTDMILRKQLCNLSCMDVNLGVSRGVYISHTLPEEGVQFHQKHLIQIQIYPTQTTLSLPTSEILVPILLKSK